MLLSSDALICATSGFCSVYRRADTVVFSLQVLLCFRLLPPNQPNADAGVLSPSFLPLPPSDVHVQTIHASHWLRSLDLRTEVGFTLSAVDLLLVLLSLCSRRFICLLLSLPFSDHTASCSRVPHHSLCCTSPIAPFVSMSIRRSNHP